MASRLKEEDLRLNIIVNGDKGRKEILDLEIAIVSLTNFGYYMEWTAHIQKKRTALLSIITNNKNTIYSKIDLYRKTNQDISLLLSNNL